MINIEQGTSMKRALMVALLVVTGAPVTYAQSSASAFTTGFRYDAARRLVGTISPSDGVSHRAVRNTYDGEGRLTRIELGTLSQWQSEAVKPVNWTGFSVAEQTDRTYDLSGRLLTEWRKGVVSDARLTQYTYDDDGRLLCRAIRMNPASYTALPTSACTLGAQGTDGPDRITRFVYDAAGQVLNEQRAYGTALQQNYSTAAYTANGKIDWVEDARGNRSDYAYDGFDRVWRLYLPQATSGTHAANPNDYEQYAFDANGNRTSVRLRSGETITYAFDALNRMSLKDLPTGDDVVYSYDLLGNRVFAKYGSVFGYGVMYETDGFGQVLSTVSASAAGSLQLLYKYDAEGNRTRITWPDNKFIEYTYDGLNRVDQIRENGATSGVGLLIDYSYDSLGRRTSVARSNGTATSYAYDGISRLSSLGQDLASVGTDLTMGFAYNPASQVTQRAVSNSSYDYVPSVQSKSYVSNGLNRYSSVGGVSYTYDGRGNLTSDGSRSFAYDLENHLLTVSGSGSLALTYDPLGRLWSTTSGSSTTRFLYDGDRLVAEYNGSTLLRRYVHSTGIDEPVVWYEGSGLTQRSWLHGDQQGSVIATSNGSGVGTVYTYGAFGEIGSSSWGGSRFRYTGQIVLPEAKLYHYKARIYDPGIGRFLQTDPVGYSDDYNLYAYVGNDPLNNTDPTGEDCENPDNGSCETVTVTAQRISPVEFTGAAAVVVGAQEQQSGWRDLLARAGDWLNGDCGKTVNCLTFPLWGGPGAATTRALQAADFGAQASIKVLQGSLSIQGNVATVSVRYLQGNLVNAWEAANALKSAARAAGATTLRIEGTVANPSLLRVLERMFGPAGRGAAGGAQDYWTIPLGP